MPFIAYQWSIHGVLHLQVVVVIYLFTVVDIVLCVCKMTRSFWYDVLIDYHFSLLNRPASESQIDGNLVDLFTVGSSIVVTLAHKRAHHRRLLDVNEQHTHRLTLKQRRKLIDHFVVYLTMIVAGADVVHQSKDARQSFLRSLSHGLRENTIHVRGHE